MKNTHSADSFALALEAQAPFLMRLARAILADEHAAEDLVQDTLVSALSASGGDRGRGDAGSPSALHPKSVRAWLATALRRRSIDRFRWSRPRATDDSQPMEQVIGAAATPDEIAVRLERQQLLHNALLAIPDKYRTVLVLRFQDGLALKAIASALDAPVPTIKSRVHRGLELVKQELGRAAGPDEEGRAGWLGAVCALASDSGSRSGAVSTPAGAAAVQSPQAFLWTAGLLKAAALLVAIAGTVFFVLRIEPARPSGGDVQGVRERAVVQDLGHTGSPSSVGQPGASVHLPEDERRKAVSGFAEQPVDGAADARVVLKKLAGRVVCSMTGEPVVAHLQLGDGLPSTASFARGDFLLDVPASELPPLQVRHPRFETLELPVDALEGSASEDGVLDLGVLQLVPSDRAELVVLDPLGAPLAGVECTLHRRLYRELDGRGPGPAELDAGRPLGLTDHDGRLRFPLASSGAVTARDAQGRVGASVVATGRDNRIRIEGPARRMVVRYVGTDEPVARRTFPIGWQQGAVEAGLFVQTDELGRVDLPAGAGTLTLCKSEPRLLLDALWVGERRVGGVDPGDFKATVPLSLEDTEILVEVSNHEVPLRLVDAVTGQPVTGIAYCHNQFSGNGGPWQGVTATTPYPVQAGEMLAHSWFVEPDPDGEDYRKRRWIVMAGYAPKIIEGARDLRGATISLEPCESRVLLILDALGRPVATRVSVQFESGIAIGVETDASGLAGPFPWTAGEDWLVWTGVGRRDPGTTVEAAELEGGSSIPVRLASRSGAIQIVGLPADSPPLFALAEGGPGFPVRREEWIVPSSSEEAAADPVRSVWIDGLSPGDYAVGPENWVSQLVSRSQAQRGLGRRRKPAEEGPHPLLVRVGPGEAVQVDWNPGWFEAEPLTGRVLCEGLPGRDLAVLAVYDRTGTDVSFGTTSPWRFCDEQGRFSTPPGGPRPVAFLIARFEYDVFGRQPIVLDSQLVREDGLYRVVPTAFELVASNAEEWADATARLRPTVWLRGDARALSAPMEFLHGAKWQSWNPAEPLRMTHLPAHIATLRLTFPEPGTPMEVQIRPGVDSRVEVHVPLPSGRAGERGGVEMRTSR